MSEEIQLTETEELATDRGWAPKEQWDGDPDQWVDASTFVRQGELMDRISSQTKQLKSQSTEINKLKTAMTSLAETNKKIAIKEYEKAMKDLKTKKAEALENEDHNAVVEYDEQLSDLKDNKKELEEQETESTQTNQIHPDVIEWMDKNEWYGSDTILSGAVDSLAAEYINQNPSAKNSPRQALEYVEAKLKEEFPHKFGGRKRPSATAESDEPGARSKATSKNKKFTERNLTSDQKKIAKTIVATGVMTMQEYVDQLAELGEVEG